MGKPAPAIPCKVKCREIRDDRRSQTLPWWLVGGGAKTTENKIHLFPLGPLVLGLVLHCPIFFVLCPFNVQAVVLTFIIPTLLILWTGLRQNQSTWKPACYVKLLVVPVDFKRWWYEGTRTVPVRNRWSYAADCPIVSYAHLLPRNIAGAFMDDLSKFPSSLSFRT
jgi:hypothetical protein